MVFWLISMALLADWANWHSVQYSHWLDESDGIFDTNLDGFSDSFTAGISLAKRQQGSGVKYNVATILAGVSAGLSGIELYTKLMLIVMHS